MVAIGQEHRDVNAVKTLHSTAILGDVEGLGEILEAPGSNRDSEGGGEDDLDDTDEGEKRKSKNSHEGYTHTGKQGAAPDTPDANGRFPSHLAALSGQTETLALLLAFGADPNAERDCAR